MSRGDRVPLRSPRLLAAGLLLGPLALVIQHNVAYSIGSVGCSGDPAAANPDLPIWLVLGACLLVALGGLASGAMAWRSASDEGGRATATEGLLAALGAGLSAIAAAAIVLGGLVPLLIDGCG